MRDIFNEATDSQPGFDKVTYSHCISSMRRVRTKKEPDVPKTGSEYAESASSNPEYYPYYKVPEFSILFLEL